MIEVPEKEIRTGEKVFEQCGCRNNEDSPIACSQCAGSYSDFIHSKNAR